MTDCKTVSSEVEIMSSDNITEKCEPIEREKESTNELICGPIERKVKSNELNEKVRNCEKLSESKGKDKKSKNKVKKWFKGIIRFCCCCCCPQTKDMD